MMRVLGFFVVSIIVLSYFTAMHESAHIQVTKLHGCEDPTIKFNWGTVSVNCASYSHNDSAVFMQETYLQSMTEIIGYHASAFLLLGLVFFGWSVIK